MKWKQVPAWDIAFGVPPKNGTQSLKLALKDQDVLYRQGPPPGRKVFVVRHPIERFNSLWRDKCKGKYPSVSTGLPIHGMGVEQLAEYIFSGVNDNHHWRPQARLLGDADAELVALPQFAEWWGEQGFPVPLTQEHTSGNDVVRMRSETMRALRAYYIDDIALYRRAWRGEER